MTDQDHIRKIIDIKSRRLRALEERQAQSGLGTPIDILTEIKDIQTEVAELETKLRAFESPSSVSARNQNIPASRPRIYHNLPQPDYENFVGRQDELQTIYNLLLPYPKSRYHVVTIDGIGGIGKSALALEVAHHYLRNAENLPTDERFEAIIWVSAKKTMLTGEGIKKRPHYLEYIDDIYTSIAITLGRKDITRSRDKEQHELVKHALTQQRTLLLIDNLETVDDERVMMFIHEVPDPTKVIITTRHWLNIAYPIRLLGMGEKDALALIYDESKKKSFQLSEGDSSQLFQRTGGVPLAIVWSISQMAYGYGCEAVLTRLGQPINDIIEFCFEGSAQRIKSRPSFKILMASTLFSSDASREALGSTAGLSVLDQDDGLVELEKLSLVNRNGKRFQILPLTLVFSKAELAKQPDLEEELRHRWIKYYQHYLAEQGQLYESLDSVKTEIDNILGIMDWCLHIERHEEYIEFLQKMNFYLWATGSWSTWS